MPIKDLAVLIPLFATSLAVSWEVGRFQALGGFFLFSLSEHLLAAIEALPVALVYSVFLAASSLPTIAILQNEIRLSQSSQPRGKTIAKLAGAIVLLGFGTWYIYRNFVLSRDAIAVACMVLAFAAVAVNALWLRLPWASPVVLSLFGGTSIILAMLLGANHTLTLLAHLKNTGPDRYIATIFSKNESSKGYVLMVGERGLLVYFPERDLLSFQKTDEVRKIEWQGRSW